jgi:hypothetical protein
LAQKEFNLVNGQSFKNYKILQQVVEVVLAIPK